MSQEIQLEPLNEPKKKNPNFIFGVLSVIGSCLINFVYPSVFAFCTLCVYQTSYIKHNGGTADISYTMFYYPVLLLFQSIFGLIAGIIFSKVGVHWTNLIGTFIFILAAFIMYISARFYLDMISSALYGIGVSILMFPSTTNSCKYFMNHIGLINGIVETFISLGSSFFNFIGEEIINPDFIPSDPQDHLYDEKIAKRVKIYLLIQLFSSLGVYLISEILTKTYDENRTEEFSIKSLLRFEEIKSLFHQKKDLKLIDDKNEEMQSMDEKENKSKENNEIDKNKKIKKTRKEQLKIALKSWKFWRYNLISLSQSPVSDMIFAMYRGIGETYRIDQNALQLIGTLTFVIEFILSFVFGILCDYVNFRILIFINNMIGSMVGITYYYTFHSSFWFTFLTLLISVQSAGYYSLKDYHLMKVFGTEIYIDLSGVVCLFTGIVVIILTFITYIIETELQDKDTAYLFVFPVFGIFNFMGVILGLFEEDVPFNYGE